MDKRKPNRLLPAGSLALAVLIVLSSLCLAGCGAQGGATPGTESPTEASTEPPINAIYYTGFEETDSEKFTVGDFGIDPSAAAVSSKYNNWSLVTPFDSEHGSVQIKTFGGNQVLSLSNSGEEGEYENTIQLCLGGFENLDEVWLSYAVAFTSKKISTFLPAPIGSDHATYFGTNAVNWRWSSKEGKFRGLEYADFSGIPVETLKWYAVEVHYAKGEKKATVEVYIDGQLTKADVYNSFNEQVNALTFSLNNLSVGECEMLLDNLAVSAERLTNFPMPATMYALVGVEDLAINASALTAVESKADTYTMIVGELSAAVVEITPADADYTYARWSSTDSSIAMVYPDGRILAISPGTAVITAVTEEPEATFGDQITVIVTEKAVMKTMQVASLAQLQAALDEVANINANGGMTGDIDIILADGYYYLTETLKLGPEHSGTNGYNVNIKAAENATPILSGATVITGTWTKVEGTDYYAIQVSKDVDSRQMFVNNIRATRARGEGDLDYGNTVTDDEGRNIGFTTTYTELASFQYPQDLELVFQVSWTQPRCGVTQLIDNQDGTLSLIMDQPGWSGIGSPGARSITNRGLTSVNKDSLWWYENALELLDEPGEWYLDTHSSQDHNILYYMPRAWEDLKTAYVTMPTLDNAIDTETADGALVEISGTFSDAAHNEVETQIKNIRFDGITFADTTWMRPNTGNGVSDSQNNHIRQHGDILAPGAVLVQAADSIWFTNCTFTRLGINGLQLIDGVQNSMIIGNHFYDISGNAINVGEPYDAKPETAYAQGLNMMRNDDILNNFIHNIGVDYGSSAAISVGFAADMDMNHNEIFDIPYSGYHIGYGWDSEFQNNTKNMHVEYNFIHDLMNVGIHDGGAIYTNGKTSGEGYNYIRRNYVRNQEDLSSALYPDAGTTWIQYVENVIDLSETPNWRDRAAQWTSVYAVGGHVQYINNFATTDSHLLPAAGYDEEDDVNIELPTVSATASWTHPVALEVIAHAGLESAYSDLRNGQVERFDVLVDGLVYSNAPKKLEVGGKLQVGFTVSAIRGGELIADGLNYTYYCVSDDPAIAEVQANGDVVAKSAGSTTIRVMLISNNILKLVEIPVTVS